MQKPSIERLAYGQESTIIAAFEYSSTILIFSAPLESLTRPNRMAG